MVFAYLPLVRLSTFGVEQISPFLLHLPERINPEELFLNVSQVLYTRLVSMCLFLLVSIDSNTEENIRACTQKNDGRGAHRTRTPKWFATEQKRWQFTTTYHSSGLC
jgi:hypothetical protein